MDTAFAEELPCYQPTARQIAALAPAGFDVVINLLPERNRLFLREEKELVHTLGMQYIPIPVVWAKPTLNDLERFFDCLDEHRPRQLFIHCAENKRVSVFVALYRIHRLGWQPARALREVHRIWQPNTAWMKFIERALQDAGLATR